MADRRQVYHLGDTLRIVTVCLFTDFINKTDDQMDLFKIYAAAAQKKMILS